jgi:hypothetical protein
VEAGARLVMRAGAARELHFRRGMADEKSSSPKSSNQPQSYGDQAEWVTGKTGQNVNDPKAAPPNSQHGDFYESRRDSETSGAHQGGTTSEAEADPGQAAAATETADQPQKKVSGAEGGAVRDSFFKDRDYK